MSHLDLTLPGDIPGLLRRGSPVVVVSTERQTTDCSGRRLDVGDRAVIADEPTNDWCVAVGETSCDMGPPWSELFRECVALDLIDATGRAHAAWWIAENYGPASRVAAGFPLESVAFVCGSYGWVLTNVRGHVGWRGDWPIGMSVGLRPKTVSWLTDLDWSDRRTLPDGSRWVDAEALRRVCLHIAGRTP